VSFFQHQVCPNTFRPVARFPFRLVSLSPQTPRRPKGQCSPALGIWKFSEPLPFNRLMEASSIVLQGPTLNDLTYTPFFPVKTHIPVRPRLRFVSGPSRPAGQGRPSSSLITTIFWSSAFPPESALSASSWPTYLQVLASHRRTLVFGSWSRAAPSSDRI